MLAVDTGNEFGREGTGVYDCLIDCLIDLVSIDSGVGFRRSYHLVYGS